MKKKAKQMGLQIKVLLKKSFILSYRNWPSRIFGQLFSPLIVMIVLLSKKISFFACNLQKFEIYF